MTIADRCLCGLFVGERLVGTCWAGDGRCAPQAPRQLRSVPVPKRIRVAVELSDLSFNSVDDDGELAIWLALEADEPYTVRDNSIDVCVAAGGRDELIPQLEALIVGAQKTIAKLREMP